MTLGLLREMLENADQNLIIYGVSKIRVEPPFLYLIDSEGNELKPIDFIKEFDKERKEINGGF